ncbi:unnamed protein product [Auanema sp. JU1783]|nr:unnamed protein product [Auanema sp. JU1783]
MLRTKNRYVVRVSKTKGGVFLSKLCIFTLYFTVFLAIYLIFFPVMRKAYDGFDLEENLKRFSSNNNKKEEAKYLIDNLNLDCSSLKNKNFTHNSTLMLEYETWTFSTDSVIKSILDSSKKCNTIKSLFPFPTVPKSKEEKDFPLAYGIIVYYNFVQFLFMLSSIYEPQNHYCVAVSGSATREFKMLAQITSECFHNVHVLIRPPIFWGSFEIINSTYTCMEMLTKQSHWKYFQYLSGVDAPLKTNREMVRIFKQMNESANVEFLKYPYSRLRGKKMADSPVPIVKSSLSALVPREAADYMIQSNVTRQLLRFLKGTGIPDESFWGTVFGNVDVFPVPGAINSTQFLLEQAKIKRSSIDRQAKVYMTYYLSRYQVWKKTKFCQGKLSSGSCVYGPRDFSHLVSRPHLIAHKFYTNFQPAGYFCVLKEIRHRSIRGITAFEEYTYNKTPLVEVKSGKEYENLSHKLWLTA